MQALLKRMLFGLEMLYLNYKIKEGVDINGYIFNNNKIDSFCYNRFIVLNRNIWVMLYFLYNYS